MRECGGCVCRTAFESSYKSDRRRAGRGMWRNTQQFFCHAPCAAEGAMKINIHIASQQLELLDDAGKLLRCYTVSTAANGVGEVCGSYCTPRGRHIIRAKISTTH